MRLMLSRGRLRRPNRKDPPLPKADRPRAYLNRSAILERPQSADLRSRLLTELSHLTSSDDLLAFAKASLPLKNTLLEADARAIEAAYQTRLEQAAPSLSDPPQQERPADTDEAVTTEPLKVVVRQVKPCKTSRPQTPGSRGLPSPRSLRGSGARHICCSSAPSPAWSASRPPSDAHHLKFAQPRALGRKVSDEFTVPLCRSHHQALHRHGNEPAWWANLQISPLPVASELWASSLVQGTANALSPNPAAATGVGKGGSAAMTGPSKWQRANAALGSEKS